MVDSASQPASFFAPIWTPRLRQLASGFPHHSRASPVRGGRGGGVLESDQSFTWVGCVDGDSGSSMMWCLLLFCSNQMDLLSQFSACSINDVSD